MHAWYAYTVGSGSGPRLGRPVFYEVGLRPTSLVEDFFGSVVRSNQKMSDVATDSDIELAKNAKSAFDNHRYESCLSSLNKLLDARRNDGRVAHNRAVAQYLLSNYTLTDDFRKSLHAVSSQVRTEWKNKGERELPWCALIRNILVYYDCSSIEMRKAVVWKYLLVIKECYSSIKHSFT